MESTAFNQAAWNPLHLIGMHFTMLHGMYCIQSRCMEFTAFNWDPLHNDAWNPLRSIKIHCTTLHGIHCILSPYQSHMSLAGFLLVVGGQVSLGEFSEPVCSLAF